MSRRRRRVKIRSSSVELFAIVFNLLLLIGGSSAAQSSPSIVYGLCKTLPANISRQLKLCRFVSYSAQADEAVANGASRGLAECRNQFRSERWNCTHAAGDHHLLTSKLTQSVGNRESSFLQAILAAGIVHSISTACSTGSLNDCACDKSRMGSFGQREQTWKWGGCSSNIRHGLFYAKHLVDLLDAVHDYHNQQQQHHQMQRSLSGTDQHHRQTRRHHNNNQHHHQHQHQHRHLIDKRSATFEQEGNFCLAQNISQTSHIQLVKSLLAKNSLERHPNFRLAMNAHNNRVGRMTVSKQMVRKCRCHGLSGSCSLKTCWMELNEFKEIGKELKRKYEASIHLPTAINVNRLIPMMDRNEISIILQQQHEQQPQVQESSIVSSQPSTMTPTSELPAASNDNMDNLRAANSPAFGPLQPEAWTSGELLLPPARLNFYERHKQLEQRLSAPSLVPAPILNGPMPTPHHHHQQQQQQQQQHQQQNATSLFLHGDEVPVHITPMSHLQYQALLRDLKLCNGNASSSPLTPTILTRSGHLSTRDLHQFDSRLQQHQVALVQRHQLGRKSMVTNNEIGANKLAATTNHKQVATGGQSQASQLQPVQVQAQLSQLLQANNRDELVYLHKSPDYCEADLRHGYAGVKSRQCSMEPQAPDSCDRLCCGRGYERREIELRYNCDCKFQYCCEIHCNVCQKMLVEFVCK